MNLIELSAIKEENTAKLPPGLNLSLTKRYTGLIIKYPVTGPWDYISKPVKQIITSVENKYGSEISGLFHKIVLSELLLNRNNAGHVIKGADIHYPRYFEGLIKRLKDDDPALFNYHQKRFCFDLGICRGTIIPMQPQYVNPDFVSLGMLFRGGMRQFFKGMLTLLFELKGIKGFLKMHTNSLDTGSLSRFTQEGWREFFMNLAELVSNNSFIKGISGTAWFFDPALKDISPELAYLNGLLIECGSHFFSQKSDKQTVRDATFMNGNRKKLYDQGKYKPSRFTVIISRKKLLDWFKSARA